jgi:DnaJ-class molecular chaperone
MTSKRTINISYEAECNKCNAQGVRLLEVCPTCAGTGYVVISKVVHITVESSTTRPVKETAKIDFNNL